MIITRTAVTFALCLLFFCSVALSLNAQTGREEEEKHEAGVDEYRRLFDQIEEETEEDGSDDRTRDTDRSSARTTFENLFEVPPLTIDLSGTHSFIWSIPVNPDHFLYDSNPPAFKNEFGLTLEKRQVQVKSEWQLDIGFISGAGTPVDEEQALRQHPGIQSGILGLTPLENYLEWQPGKLHMGFGYRRYSWGKASGLNPTDNLNPKDFSSGFSVDKLPVISASAEYYPASPVSIQTVLIPYKRGALLPVSLEAAIPDLLFAEMEIVDYIAASNTPIIAYQEMEKRITFDEPTYAPQSLVAGASGNIYTQYVDFSFYYLFDFDQFYTPVIELEQYTVATSGTASLIPQFNNLQAFRIASLTLKRNRIHRFGGDVKAIIGPVGVWIELCYSLTEDYDNSSSLLRNHDLSWVVGLDFSYGPFTNQYVQIQYYGTWVPQYDSSFYTDYPSGTPMFSGISDKGYMREYYYRSLVNALALRSEGLLQGIALTSEWSFLRGKLKPVVSAMYEFPLIYSVAEGSRIGNLIIVSELPFELADALDIVFGVELAFSWKREQGKITIDTESGAGILSERNNVSLGIRYQWHDFHKKR